MEQKSTSYNIGCGVTSQPGAKRVAAAKPPSVAPGIDARAHRPSCQGDTDYVHRGRIKIGEFENRWEDKTGHTGHDLKLVHLPI